MSHQPVITCGSGAGAMIALAMEMLGVPALVFALGMYLPLELNTPALVGGFLAHYLGQARRAGSRARRDHRIGLMAGGAIGG